MSIRLREDGKNAESEWASGVQMPHFAFASGRPDFFLFVGVGGNCLHSDSANALAAGEVYHYECEWRVDVVLDPSFRGVENLVQRAKPPPEGGDMVAHASSDGFKMPQISSLPPDKVRAVYQERQSCRKCRSWRPDAVVAARQSRCRCSRGSKMPQMPLPPRDKVAAVRQSGVESGFAQMSRGEGGMCCPLATQIQLGMPRVCSSSFSGRHVRFRF